MKTNFLPFLALLGALFSCVEDSQDVENQMEVPSTYSFERDGASSVSFQGQTDRLNMLSEIKTYLKAGDGGSELSSQKLLDMYANANEPFENAELNASTKQLENKTNPAEVDGFKQLLDQAAKVSADVAVNGTMAEDGVAGRISRGDDRYINVNEKGWEFTQLVEKGLMGAVFYHQIFNVYLSDSKIGEGVDNEAIEEGKNYTTMEHHWDEAFGYWGVPTDFPNGDPVLDEEHSRFWAGYTYGLEETLGINQPLMDAYIKGRAAIVADNHVVKNEQIDIIIELHELVAAAKAVHYIKSAIGDLNNQDTGNLFHHLSEGHGFIKAFGYSPNSNLSQAEINDILNVDLGEDGNFWTVTPQGLQNAKDKILNAYPELKEVEDEL
ncbi:DUF4856 domain-containing protein [Echinicola jeungdonensis]|uniref:DUF4856 domain-containing protein n=1 Tax=Echinicola jeungdonensis TaxID=709343 RepID=A0ABV5J0G4_9BACT|nr:DUF4856 domain-containing protein [Echinicola jeungdonensis]MDN3671084.1 DUF4856 domain-containing protein [Echinicola jeungdonensis]